MRFTPTLVALLSWCVAPLAVAEPPNPSGAKTPSYLLRYKCNKGDVYHWTVTHVAKIRSTVRGTTQMAETSSHSVKVWRVSGVDEKGVSFIHAVKSVQMRHKSTGRDWVEFDSTSSEPPPLEFQGVAEDVGVPLTKVVMSDEGNIIQRLDLRKKKKQSTSGYEGPMTIPLPRGKVRVGGVWTTSHIVRVPTRSKEMKKIRVQQRFTLKKVTDDVAEIYVESVILTPIHDPMVKAQLIQSKTKGTVRFDIAQGRVVGQDLSIDERIVGAPTGGDSSMHYVMQFVEKFQPQPPQTAGKPTGASRPK